MIIPNILKNEIHVPNHQTDWFVSNESINLVFLGDLREQCNPRPRPAEFPFHAQHDPFLLMTEQHYRALLQVVNLRGPMGSQCVHRSVSTSQPWGWPECSCSTSCATDPPYSTHPLRDCQPRGHVGDLSCKLAMSQCIHG